jgi:hypothetical protein
MSFGRSGLGLLFSYERQAKSGVLGAGIAAQKGHFGSVLAGENKKRIPFLKNKPRKLLKTRSCGKNEPKNELSHVVENK